MNRHKRYLLRWTYYIGGMLMLAMGLTLNTKSNLGTAPIISVPYALSFLCDTSFANLTLIVYVLFVIAQFVIKGNGRRMTDVLQIPLSIVFTRCLSLFTSWFDFSGFKLVERFVVLIFAVILVGVGAALSVNMNLVVNPGDGFVQSISLRTGKELGTVKNIVDIVCVLLAASIGLFSRGKLLGVGWGTIISMIGVGRVIALFNYFFKDVLKRQIFVD